MSVGVRSAAPEKVQAMCVVNCMDLCAHESQQSMCVQLHMCWAASIACMYSCTCALQWHVHCSCTCTGQHTVAYGSIRYSSIRAAYGSIRYSTCMQYICSTHSESGTPADDRGSRPEWRCLMPWPGSFSNMSASQLPMTFMPSLLMSLSRAFAYCRQVCGKGGGEGVPSSNAPESRGTYHANRRKAVARIHTPWPDS